MPAFVVTGPPPDYIDFGAVSARSPVDAVAAIHVDGLGPGRVRVAGDRLLFSSPDDQALCAGVWQVVRQGSNATRAVVKVEIAAPGAGRGLERGTSRLYTACRHAIEPR
jgi:hypothetical protein